MTCDDDAHPISGHGRFHAPNPHAVGPRDDLRPSHDRGTPRPRCRYGAAKPPVPPPRCGGRCSRWASPTIQPARRKRPLGSTNTLWRPKRATTDEYIPSVWQRRASCGRGCCAGLRRWTLPPLSSASIRCLRRRNVASSIPMAASSSSLLCCPLVGHETRRRTLEHARIRSQIELAAARPCAKSQTGGYSGVRADSSSRRRSAW